MVAINNELIINNNKFDLIHITDVFSKTKPPYANRVKLF